MHLSFEEKYQVIGSKSQLYEGQFITAVLTTGIFCRPSCYARKPKRENVRFFDTVQEAIQHGFRPCKLCKPLQKAGETPGYIQQLIGALQADPDLVLKDADIRARGMDPVAVRRWFKKNHRLTFHAYQRQLRINRAYRQIQEGTSITDTAFGVGYDSLSGFNEGYKNVFGHSASQSGADRVITITRFATRLGPMFACATEKGICLLEFTDRRMLETEFRDLRKRLKAAILPGTHPLLERVQVEVEEYLAGSRREFSVPLDTPGTDFQQTVWNALRTIPYGRTRSYQEQAALLGNPKAVRAVAAANGANRVALMIPCHRVIGADGDLKGYGGGLARKRWLLELEANS